MVTPNYSRSNFEHICKFIPHQNEIPESSIPFPYTAQLGLQYQFQVSQCSLRDIQGEQELDSLAVIDAGE